MTDVNFENKLGTSIVVGKPLMGSIYNGGRLLLSQGTLLKDKHIRALNNWDAKNLIIKKRLPNQSDEKKGMGLIESDRKVLDNNFKHSYSTKVRGAMRSELVSDSIRSDSEKSNALIKKIGAELKSVFNAEERDLKLFKELLEPLKFGRKINIDVLEESLANQLEKRLVTNLSSQKNQFPDPLIELEAMKQLQGDYTFLHSMKVANEVGMATMQINLHNISRNIPKIFPVETVMLSGALADCGNLHKPIETLIYSTNKLDETQKKLIESHTVKGHDILGGYECAPNLLAFVALEHHETFTGTGYPEKKKGIQINPVSALVCVADKYVALSNTGLDGKKNDKSDIAELMIDKSYGDVDLFLEKFSKVGFDYRKEDVEMDPFYGPLVTFLRSKDLAKFL